MSAAEKIVIAGPELPYDVIGDSCDRAAWLLLRLTGVGASECAALFGDSKWMSEFSLWLEKTGALEARDLSDNEAIEWGVELEPVIASVYQRKTGRRVELSRQLIRSKAHPWALATLDAWTWRDGVRMPLEIKTTSGMNAEDWVDGPPVYYEWQIQQQMLVTGEPRSSIACLIGGNRFVWIDRERNEAMQRRLVHAGSAFWQRVVDGDQPAPDGSEASTTALRRLYPESNGTELQLPGTFLDVAFELEDLKGRAKVTKARIDTLENMVRDALGNAPRGFLPDGSSWSNKTQTTSSGKTTRVLRRHAKKED